MDSLVFIVGGAVVNAVVIGFFARGLLGAPVGWPRTIFLSIGVNFVISPLVNWVIGLLGLRPVVGHTVAGPAEAAVVSLVIAWVLVAEVICLAALEAVVPSGSVPNPVVVLLEVPSQLRRAARYSQILAIATRYGLGAYLRPRRRAPNAPASKLARSLREALTEGGVTFVKLGQMLATRPDLLPMAYIEELSRLHNKVPAEPWDAVRPVVEDELGRPVGQVFASIDEQPLAAASVAQIHLARLADGTQVVVKIQRPRARAQATADLDIVRRLARLLDARADWARNLGVLDLVDGFAEALDEELDYRIELANMLAVAAASRDVVVPRPYPELSGRHVLVMEYLLGQPLSDAAGLLRTFTAEQRTAMAEHLLTAVLRQVMVSGVFHADLHPGNIVIDADAGVGLLDFGSVGRLDRGARTSLSTLLLAFERQDAIAATDALIDLLDAPPDLDDRALERQLGQLMLRHGAGVGGAGNADLFLALFKLVLAHRLSVPSGVAAAFRALGALEGSLQRIAEDLDLVAVARAQGGALMAQQLSPSQLRGSLEMQLASILPIVQRLPRQVHALTKSLETGTFTVSVRTFADPADRSFLTGLVQQIVVAFLAAAMAISGILLIIGQQNGPVLTPGLTLYGFLGFVFLLFASVLGSRALALVFRHTAAVRGRQRN